MVLQYDRVTIGVRLILPHRDRGVFLVSEVEKLLVLILLLSGVIVYFMKWWKWMDQEEKAMMNGEKKELSCEQRIRHDEENGTSTWTMKKL